MTVHSPDSGFSFNPLANFALSARGSLRLLFGGKLGDFSGDWISKAALTALVLAAALFCLRVWRVARMGATVSRPPYDLFVWAGVYAAFLFFWMPQNTFYRLFCLPPLILMVATAVGHASATRTAVWLLVPVVALWNFVFVAYPQSRPEFNAPLEFALAHRQAWAPGSAIVFHRFYADLWTMSYFSRQAAWIGIDRPDLKQLGQALKSLALVGTHSGWRRPPMT